MSWQIVDEKILEKIKEQKKFEDLAAKELTTVYESAQNPLVKLLVHCLIFDTMKHSETYQLIIDLNNTSVMGEESKNLSRNEIEKHVKEEAKMLKQAKEISEALKDKNVKQLILNIMEDENKYHEFLKKLYEILDKKSEEWNAYIYDLITGFP